MLKDFVEKVFIIFCETNHRIESIVALFHIYRWADSIRDNFSIKTAHQ